MHSDLLTSAEPTGEGDLSQEDSHGEPQLRLENTEYGFQLVGAGGPIVETFESPLIDGVRYGVHIVRTMSGEQNSEMRRDMIVVNPASQEFRVYPLYQASVGDGYTADAIAKGYGFIDERQLLYVAAVNDEARNGGYYYRAELLDIVSGQRTMLRELDIDAGAISSYAIGWLNGSMDRLMINSMMGPLWVLELRTHEFTTSLQSFVSPWPFIMIDVSPDGERIWFDHGLHDAWGTRIATLPPSDGFEQYPAFGWSPDSRYSVYQDSIDQSEEHLIADNGEYKVKATQRIRFMDHEGQQLRTVHAKIGSGNYIEVAGWLDGKDGDVLLREYRLEQSPDDENVKLKSQYRYRLFNIVTGKSQDLNEVDDLSKQSNPVAVIGRVLAVVDPKESLISIIDEYRQWLSDPGEMPLAWTFDTDSGLEYRTLDPVTRQMTKQSIPDAWYENIFSVGDDWLATTDMRYIMLMSEH